ncbi:MAG: oligosaccharide flippase family protein [Bacteroidales bacterium]|nr:oligosaccharide flippase family protein [Bacteroidales bacterium]MBS3774303.1 oligosaccharide flippase family protein [Bacteroidales bacterium]
MQQYRRLAGQTALYGLGTIVPRFLNYVVLTPFYTHIFSLEQYGIVTNLYAYVVFLLILLTYGLETGYFKFTKSEDDPGKVYSTIMASLLSTSLLFILVILLFNHPIAKILEYPDRQYLIVLFSSVVTIDAFSSVPFAKLRFEGKAKKFGFLKIFNVVVNLFFNFVFFVGFPYLNAHYPSSFLLDFYDASIGVGYVFISNLFASAMTLLLLLPEIKILPGLIDLRLLKRVLKYSLPLLMVGLAGTINEVADKELIKRFVSDENSPMRQVGIYGANYKLGMLMTIFIQMFRYAAEPFYFTKMKDYDAKETYAKVMRYFIIFGLFIFLVVNLYIEIFKYFIDSKFHSGLHIVPIILLANLFLGINYNLSIWYKLSNLTRYGAMIALLGAAITIFMNIALLPVYGYEASAWTTLICYFTMMMVSYLLGRKHYFIPYALKSILFYFVIALAIYFMQNFIHYPSIIQKNLFNSLFLLLFLWFVLRKERITIRDIKTFIGIKR